MKLLQAAITAGLLANAFWTLQFFFAEHPVGEPSYVLLIFATIIAVNTVLVFIFARYTNLKSRSAVLKFLSLALAVGTLLFTVIFLAILGGRADFTATDLFLYYLSMLGTVLAAPTVAGSLIGRRLATSPVSGKRPPVELTKRFGELEKHAPQTKYCISCGTGLPFNAKFCDACGSQQP
jgi:ribosomal protein L40E